jgi:hypothetical protein
MPHMQPQKRTDSETEDEEKAEATMRRPSLILWRMVQRRIRWDKAPTGGKSGAATDAERTKNEKNCPT